MFRRLSRVFLLILIACTLGACSTENAPINLTSLINEEETGELRGITEEVEDGSRIASSKSIIKVTPTVEPAKEKSAGKAEESYADMPISGRMAIITTLKALFCITKSLADFLQTILPRTRREH